MHAFKLLFATLAGLLAIGQVECRQAPQDSTEQHRLELKLETLPIDPQDTSLQTLNLETCRKLRAYEELLPLYPIDDSRLTMRLRGAINTLFHIYHGLPADCNSSPDLESLPSQPCGTNKLIGIIERKLIETVAAGPCKESVRILSSRLLEVLEMKEKYEKNEHCSKMDEEEADSKVQSYLAEVEAKLERTWAGLGYRGLH